MCSCTKYVSAAAGVHVCKRDPSFISLQGKRDRFPSHGGTDYMYGTLDLVDLPYSNVVDPDLV